VADVCKRYYRLIINRDAVHGTPTQSLQRVVWSGDVCLLATPRRYRIRHRFR
jgi:hypothetical protein